MPDGRRALPSVSSLLESDGVRTLLTTTARSVVVDAIRKTLEHARTAPASAPSSAGAWADAIASEIAVATRPSLRHVINATGVVLHTNLGRAPLAAAAIDAVTRVASGFSNIELDVEQGTRGSRYVHCAALLRELTGAEDALVVNNGAAALVLALNTLADGRGAIVSRGELIEIGGSFRIPDIMAKSGVRLVEVGTTNRTHLDDYRRAITDETGIVVKVHRSNFAVAGFVAEASASELASLAAATGVALLHDLGSGLLVSLEDVGLRGEPTAREAVAAGGSIQPVVTMSGDKLLGGPQAGLILGPRDVIDRIRRNPLTRSYRVDKLTLAALEATLSIYRDPARAKREIPALAQLTCGLDALRQRGEAMREELGDAVTIVESDASVGGGAFPTARIPSLALAMATRASLVEERLRANEPAVIGRLSDGQLLLDLRTIFPSEDRDVVAALRVAMQ